MPSPNTSTYDDINNGFFKQGVEQSSFDIDPQTVQHWFEDTLEIENIKFAYWITPPISFAIIIKTEDTGLEYVVFEAGKLYLTDIINKDLHECVKQYTDTRSQSDFRILYPLINDPYISRINITGNELHVYHTHEKTDQQLSLPNAGPGLSSNSYIKTLMDKYYNQIPETIRDEFAATTVTTQDGRTIQFSDHDSTSHSYVSINNKQHIPTTPFDLLYEQTFTPTTLAYIWGLITRKENMYVHCPSVAVTRDILEAFSFFTPDSTSIATLSDSNRIQPPVETVYNCVQQSMTSISRKDMADTLMRLSVSYVLDTGINSGDIASFFGCDSAIGYIGTHKQLNHDVSELSIPELFNETNVDTSLFDLFITQEYISDGCSRNTALHTTNNNSLVELHSDDRTPATINVDGVSKMSEVELRAREHILTLLSDENITNPQEIHRLLSEAHSRITTGRKEHVIQMDSLYELPDHT